MCCTTRPPGSATTAPSRSAATASASSPATTCGAWAAISPTAWAVRVARRGGQPRRAWRATTRRGVVQGRADLRVEGDLQTRVGGDERREVQGTTDLPHEGDRALRVHGSATTLVGRHDGPRSWVLHVEGESTLSSTGPAEITSDKGLVLRCGTSAIHLGARPDRGGDGRHPGPAGQGRARRARRRQGEDQGQEPDPGALGRTRSCSSPRARASG